MSTLMVDAPRRMELARVFSGGWRLLRLRWGAMLLTLALFGWAPQIIVNLAYLAVARVVDVRSSGGVASFAIVGLINIVAPVVMRAVATAVALQPPQPAPFPPAVAATLRAAPALAPIWLLGLLPSGAVLVLQYLGEAGQFAWIVGLAAWPLVLVIVLVLGVFSPVVLAEGLGTLAAARRSFVLLSRNRWKFLALYLIIQVVAGSPAVVAGELGRALGVSQFDASTRLLQALAGQLVADAALIWCSAVLTAAYLELARIRAGVVPRDVVEVFA